MPNHVVNEIVFRGVDADAQSAIKSQCLNAEGFIDFGVLLPIPINVWMFSHSQIHEKLGGNALDWCTENWGTKWNAYGQDDEHYDRLTVDGDTLTLRFQTAWSPPYGWLLALFNTTKRDFDHNWMDEGAAHGVSAAWRYPKGDDFRFKPWSEKPCDEPMQRHLNKLQWGVEDLAELEQQ